MAHFGVRGLMRKTMNKLLLAVLILGMAAPVVAQVPEPIGPMPKEEALKFPTGAKPPADLAERIKLSWLRNQKAIKDLPKATAAEFDWRKNGLGIDAENQGNCGSCWNFSGSDAVGSALIRAGIMPKSDTVSKQYTMDCGSNGGCNGDWPENPIKWCKDKGLPTTANYGPYQARRENCKAVDSARFLKIKDYGYVGSENGVPPVQSIKDAMSKYGPLACAVAADSSFNNPGSNVIRGRNGSVNHAVILVGWKDDSTLTEGGYWIMRNSWGKSWGENGYCRIAYGAKSIGYGALWIDAGQSPDPVPPGPDPVPPGPTPDGKGFTGSVTYTYSKGVLIGVKTGTAEGVEGELQAAGVSPKIIIHIISLIRHLKAKDWDAVLDDISAIMQDVLSEKSNKPRDRMPKG
jgi:hypothetical protein